MRKRSGLGQAQTKPRSGTTWTRVTSNPASLQEGWVGRYQLYTAAWSRMPEDEPRNHVHPFITLLRRSAPTGESK